MSYTQLTLKERYQIEALKKEGLSQSAIARHIGVHRSTVCRELKRNSSPGGEYIAEKAAIEARLRYQYKKKNRRMSHSHIRYIRQHLQEGWSPEQISGRMRLDGLDPVSHETIYRYVYRDQKQGGTLYLFLRHKRKKYTRRSDNYAKRGSIKGRIGIEARPAIVETKRRVGDWEADTIIGRGHHQGIVTLVDRHSKFTLMKKVTSKRADDVTRAILHLLEPVKAITRTITSDNGKEFAYHALISERLKSGFFFARPYHSCDRGLNEHTNGLIREYFPKHKAFEEITDKEVVAVQNRLNHRPRKVLGYKTPAEVFFAKMAVAYSVA
ncbi:IS30 family transposase [Hydrogenimonas cancrithermarum]|uniref:IS30 family transposase n=1 Tax=Hydrogenimonas cancrithermarum TaxID=2993563 RepID=A0ABM8FK65_9BACT|nr:IS30 family transposase [Hydrogenimonas cancrithermarum]BDY12693.1 IS30 family transposase [Hydrogenimonas cancrithermarum]